VKQVLCRCCQHDPIRRNGLCNSCSLYERRTGHLPSQKTLYKRGQARERRARRRAGFVVTLGPELTRLLASLYAEDQQGAA